MLRLILALLLATGPAAAQTCVADAPTTEPLLLTVAQTYPNTEPATLELRFAETQGDAVLREFWREDSYGPVWGGQWRYRGLILQETVQQVGASRAEAAVAEPLIQTTRNLPLAEIDALFPLTPGGFFAATLRETTIIDNEPVSYDVQVEIEVDGQETVVIGGCVFTAVRLTETIASTRGDFSYDVLYLPNLRIRLNLEVMQAGALAARYEPVTLTFAR